jgi:Cof subfamily protein (haloacid dehalogenase superfamily)
VSPPRLIATDLDGTLVRSDGTVSDRTRAVLARTRAAGVHVVVVTGRPPRWMHAVAEQTGHAGTALVANGAAVYDLATETLLRTDPLPPEASARVAELILDAVPDVAFAGETGAEFLREGRYHSDYGDTPGTVVVGDRDEIVTRPLLKLLARTPSHDADSLLAAAERVVTSDLATLTHASATGLLEISAAGVSKASALARTARELGVDPADVAAFGDMPNDLPMLAWAGRSYAVANAHPAVRAAAETLTETNDDDAVARVLESWF